MSENNIHAFLISLNLCVFCMIILSKRSSCADHQYEACVPSKCEKGPNITFPFYISGQQESYCGYPGFKLKCIYHGLPVLQLYKNELVVEDIFYETNSLRVIIPAFSSLNSSDCLNTWPDTYDEFDLADNVTLLHLFSSCTNPLPEGVLRSCDKEYRYYLDWASLGSNANFELANCKGEVFVTVEKDVNLTGDGLVKVLRRGFVLHWNATYFSDCSACESSGGRCGQDEYFRCFCPDGPRDRNCKSTGLNDCSACRSSGGSCGFDESSNKFICICHDGPHDRSCKTIAGKTRLRPILILIPSFAAVLMVLTSIVIVIMLIKNKRAKKKKEENDYNRKNTETFLKNYGNLAPKRYKYSQLKKMTKSFSHILGKGGYGSVYKGKSYDGRVVAVKILNESRKNGEDFVNEVASISRTSHVNIVTLLGFCFEGSKRALVYEFMPNGSLDKFISGEGHLGWEKLFEISIGIARGLEYLHRGCNMPILHLDIKPQNILLDKDFNPKIADFGLAKLCPDTASIVSMTGARGTVGYIAPEVFYRNFGDVSHKSDVYSYGMMLLEIVGEKRNVDRGAGDSTSETYFPHWVYKHLEVSNGDEDFDGVFEEDKKRKVTIVGLWCILTDPKDRPSMRRVLEMLEGKLESLEIPPKTHLASPTRPVTSVSTFGSSSI